MNTPNIDENILKPIKKENPPTPKAKTLDDLDLDKELLQQFTTAKEVLEDIRHEQDVPANQKAQVINTITNILQGILKMQQDLHNVERMKLVENTLIEVLQRHQTLREAFLEDYEKALKKLESN
jgi:tryptophan synthase beta subunit